MNHKRLLPQMTGLTLVLVLLGACGTPQPTPTPVPSTSTPTPVPPTATFTPGPPTATPTPIPPTPTPTETPVPGGIVSGRVYLMDRDEPVRTTIKLVWDEDSSEVDSTVTDEDGYYSFLVGEPGTYVIHVSVMDLLDICDNLRTESGWPVVVRTYDTSGVNDVLAGSLLMTITSGDEITLDCELYCD